MLDLSLYDNVGKMNNSEEILSLEDLNNAEAIQRLPTLVYLSVLEVIGVIGNVLILLIIGLVYKPNNFRCYILTLASLDLMTCLISIPAEIADNALPLMFYSEFFCKFSRFIGTIGKLGSAFVLVVMAVGRYRKICFPFNKDLSLKTARGLCLSAVVLSVAFSWPTLIIEGHKVEEFPGNITGYGCSTDDDLRGTEYPFIQATIMLVIFVIVFCILTILYARIIWELRDHFRMNRLLRIENNQRRTKHRVTKIFLCITIAFIFSFIPHLSLRALRTFKRGNILPPSPWVLGLLPLLARSYFVNNVVNVFVYYVGDPLFRKQCKKIKIYILSLCCRKKINLELQIDATKVVLLE